MATVIHQLLPQAAAFKSSLFPTLTKVDGTNTVFFILSYDASTDWAAFWTFRAVRYGSGNITLDLYWYADTATTGNVVWEAQITAITANTDTTDVETDSLATLNSVQDTHLGTTGQRLHQCAITISNLDSIAADDIVTIRIARDANGTNATDDMAGFAFLQLATVSYSDT